MISRDELLKLEPLDIVVVGVAGGLERAVEVAGVTLEGRNVKAVFIRECGVAPNRRSEMISGNEKVLRRADEWEEREFRQRDEEVASKGRRKLVAAALGGAER